MARRGKDFFMDLTKYAKDQPCDIRVPHHCCFDPATSVWCHVRLMNVSGLGLKSPDILGCVGCHVCHDIVDGRLTSEFGPGERRLMLLEGVARRQAILARDGILKW